tara:strand:- start:204 stop:356 length:153 start_codon:yes stop_codon:yes gene_type:complete
VIILTMTESENRFAGRYWANYIRRFSEREAKKIDEKYNANGKLLSIWKGD